MTATGAQLKLDGMAQADAAAAEEWKRRWDAAIASLARQGVEFTAEDVRAIAGAPTDHPNAAGARFNAAARRGQIRKVGYRPSSRASRHTNQLAVWVGEQRNLGRGAL